MFDIFRKVSRFRGKRTRDRLKRAASLMLTSEIRDVSNVIGREKKKISASLKHPYPYVEEVREIVAPDLEFLDSYCLVGENWRDKPSAPILPFFGCNDWKYGFLADYFPEHRVAFAPRKISSYRAFKMISELDEPVKQVAIWGYTESAVLRQRLKRKKIKVWRVEDGFIRSAELGAAHSTPYSLAIDTSGIYYDPRSGSDLEKILLEYDFSSDPNLLDQAVQLKEFIIRSRLSKYNPPAITVGSDIKIKKRIAVLGQVESDASIKYGNPKKWTAFDLIKLAYSENPGAEIIYRPHPEVYRGFQKSTLKRRHVEKFATICPPSSSFVDFVESVDHCYTISSLSGFEFLLRGKGVTVVGIPFYAGWGLTDDRSEITHRGRQLTLDELFAASYLLYPKYLADLNDSANGLLAACSRISADQEVLLYDSCRKENAEGRQFVNTHFWPALLMQDREDLNARSEFVKSFDFGRVFSCDPNELGVRALVFFCIGQLKDEGLIDLFLKRVREYIEPKLYNEILITCSGWVADKTIQNNIDWLVVRNDKVPFVRKYIEEKVKAARNLSSNVDNRLGIDCDLDSMAHALNYSIEVRQFDQSLETAEIILLSGKSVVGAIRSLIQVAIYKFDYESAILLSDIMYGIDPYGSNRYAILSNFRSRKSLAKKSLLNMSWLSKFALYKPDQIVNIRFALEGLSDAQYSEDVFRCLVAQGRLDRDLNFRKIKYYIELGLFERAQTEIQKLILSGDRSDHSRVLYSQVLSHRGRLHDAVEVIESAIKVAPKEMYIAEAFRLYIQACDYKRSLELYQFCLSNKIKVGEMHRRKLFFGNRMIKLAHETFRELEIRSALCKYFPDKFWDFSKNDKVLVSDKGGICALSIFGPGDEIRFSSIYEEIYKDFGSRAPVVITVSPKLESLFKRSFPYISFVSTPKPRHSDVIDLDACSNVPGSDIVGIVNNEAVSAITRSETSVLVTDLLATYRTDYIDFPGVPYLIPCDERISNFKKRLGAKDILVGISWRSSVQTAGRNEHYLDVSDLRPIFEVDGIQFVNLQYDDCSEELQWVEDNYPGRLINFEDLDQYNDFDGVAALMSCMDMIISPATTVVELAGAVGVETWLFSNSSELDWRKVNDSGKDVWHSSVSIVDLEPKGDKSELVNRIADLLSKRVNEFKVSVESGEKAVF